MPVPYTDPGPIPPYLTDEPTDGEALIDDYAETAARMGVSIPEAVEMVADADAERWRVRTLDDAEWAGRMLAEAETVIDGNRARAEAWTERIDTWFRASTSSAHRSAQVWRAHLEWWGRQQRAASPSGKFSASLPSVKVRTTGHQAAVVITDDEQVVEWAKVHHPEIVRTVDSVLVSELRQVVTVEQLQPVVEDGYTGEITEADAAPVTVAAVKWVDVEGEVQVDPVPGAGVRPASVTVTVTVEAGA